jgi:hypothetical protein
MARRLNPVWLVVAAAALLVAVAASYLLSPRSGRAVTTALEPTPTGSVNILIIGKDARAIGPVANEGRQRNPREAQSHSDIVIVCHVNFEVPSLSLVAIPRDLLVVVPGITAADSNTDFTRMEKVAHTYAIGGDSLLRKAIVNLLGIPIHRSIAFDFDTFRMAFDVLRPFIGRLRVGGVNLTERDQALQFARRRRGLEFDDADRCRNAVSFVRGIIARTWWLGGTRLGNILAGRLLAIVGEDADLTLDEVHQLADGLRRVGFSPVRTETAVLVGEGADVTLARYGMTLSCYLPVYGEIEKQVDRYLLDKQDVPALDFMSQEEYRAPGYLFADYAMPIDSAAPLPFDTAGMDSQLKATRLKELGELKGHDRNPPGISDRVPAETAATDSVGKR